MSRAISPGLPPRRRIRLSAQPLFALFALIGLWPLTGAARSVAHPGYRIVHSYPHNPDAFTEGLFYADGVLYESTGRNGASYIRKVELSTGRVLQQVSLEPAYFGEGIVNWKSHLIQLTWRSQIGFSYDLASLRRLGSFTYQGEGWGLTHDGHQLFMSDGSARLRRLDPHSLRQIGHLDVSENGQPVPLLNELEWVKGRLYANIWQSTHIVEIDPHSGHVTADIDLSELLAAQGPLDDPADDVLNGIAYDAEHDRLFVTGKHWPHLYQIELLPPPDQRRAGAPPGPPGR